MNPNFKKIIEKLPKLHDKLMKNSLIKWGDFKNLPKAGIYVFFENDKPMYIGRTRNFLRRSKEHGNKNSGHNSAPFAFNLAKNNFAKNNSLTRKELEGDPDFMKKFDCAKARVRNMSYRIVEVTNPIIQTIFEVYCVLELGTQKYNNFDTH